MDRDCELWYQLMVAFNKAQRFRFPFDNRISISNGIYIMFEEGEKIDRWDRVSRIGINREQNNFIGRLNDHFLKEIQRNSIFRKHYGRCLLNSRQDPYLPNWNLKFKTVEDKIKHKAKVDLVYEANIEKEVSAYIRNNVSFAVIEVNDQAYRKELEDKLIATLASCGKNIPGTNWMGRHHPDYSYFSDTGLWNVKGRKGEKVNEQDYKFILEYLQ